MVPITLFEQITCLFFAILWLHNRKVGYWTSFIWFMLATVIIETIGWLLSVYYPRPQNYWLYSIEMVGEVLFLAWIFQQFLQSFFNSKPWVITGLVIFAVCFLVAGVPSGFLRYNYLVYLLAAVLIVVASGAYFYCLLQKKEYINLRRHPEFWIVAGTFFCYFGGAAAYPLYQELITFTAPTAVSIRLIISIYSVVYAIVYGCWSYAFLCRHRQVISYS